jgi:hypothetical protein
VKGKKPRKNIKIVDPLTKEQQIALWNAENALKTGFIHRRELTLEEVLEEYGYLMLDEEREELIKRFNDGSKE